MPRHKRLCAALLILTFSGTAPMSAQMTAQAQITFSEKTAELEALEASVNDCAARQVISACYAALSRTHVLQNSYIDSENSADRIMRNAVMLLPLYMLSFITVTAAKTCRVVMHSPANANFTGF